MTASAPPPLATGPEGEEEEATPGADAAPPPRPVPPPGKKLACAGCGAPLPFDPTAGELRCTHCGRVEPIPRSVDEVVELGYREYLAEGRAHTGVPAGAERQLRCPSCGAVLLAAAETRTEACPFCSSPIAEATEPTEALIEPAAVLPFAVEERRAKQAFAGWIASRWFAPSALAKAARLGRLAGVYVPYWTYDAMTHTLYAGSRGDYYYETQTYTAVENDRTVQRSRRVRRTRWTPASGRVAHWFDDVTVLASRGLPSELAEALEPWDLAALVDFRPEYLAGFRTERYQVSLAEGFERAKRRMDPVLEALVRRDIGGDTQRIASRRTQHSGITFKHVLLPIWVAAYRFHGEVHRVLVNARTGEVQGTRPWSAWKIAAAGLAAAAAAALLYLLFGR